MTGIEFEEWCIKMLIFDGYSSVQGTRASGDFGADIIAYKNGKKYAFQCKYYSKSVGLKAVQEVMGARAYYHTDIAAVMTNSTFSKSAIDLAKESGVLLMDGKACDEIHQRYQRYHNQINNTYRFKKQTQPSSSNAFKDNYIVKWCSFWFLVVGLIALLLFVCIKVTNDTNKAYEKLKPELVTGNETVTEIEVNTIEEDSAYLSSEYILPYSNTVLLTENDIAGMTKEDIQLAINEIYARAGREFKGDNGEYFKTKSWYNPQYDKDYFNEHQYELLNEVEQANITFLIKYR